MIKAARSSSAMVPHAISACVVIVIGPPHLGVGRKNFIQSGGELINVMKTAQNRVRYYATTALRRGSLPWTRRSLSTPAMGPPSVVITNVFVD